VKVEEIRDVREGPFAGRSITFSGRRKPGRREIFAVVPEEYAPEISIREDAFLPALVLAAMVNGEDLDLAGLKTDPLLLRNCLAAAGQHQAWVSRFRTPEVSNAALRPPEPRDKIRLASFFSGGIDSLFTLTRHSPVSRHDPERIQKENISLALHVFHTGELSRILRNFEAETVLGHGAASLGASFVPVFSNIMSFDHDWYHNYARVTHSAGLASISRVLSADTSHCLVASSHTYGKLQAWGSSPITDPLYSDTDLSFIHDGSTFTRFEKTDYISRSPAALAAINVCDTLLHGQGYVNCSRCPKCLRTMTALDLCGVTGDLAPAFDWSGYNSSLFGATYFKNWSERSFASELVTAAQERGRPEIARSLQSAIARSRLLMPVAAIEDQLRHLTFTRQAKPLLLHLRSGAYRAVGLRR